ncbi:unnamed protein product [Heterobilharzia americana]|nr:unnamed protein product [Heterobilharzia americana]
MKMSLLLLWLVKMVRIVGQKVICNEETLPSVPILGINGYLVDTVTRTRISWNSEFDNLNSSAYKELTATLCDAVKEASQLVNSSIKNETDCFLIHLGEYGSFLVAGIYLEYPISEYPGFGTAIEQKIHETMRLKNIQLSHYFVLCDARQALKKQCEVGNMKLNDPRWKLCGAVSSANEDTLNTVNTQMTEIVHTTPVHSTVTSHSTDATAFVSLASVSTISGIVMLIQLF